MALSAYIKRQISRYKPVSTEGFLLYPYTVEDYHGFLIAKQSLGFIIQTLPIELMSRPLLESFFKMDYDAAINGKDGTGMFSSALLSLSMALRLAPNEDYNTQINQFRIHVDPDDPSKLKFLSCLINGKEELTISPVQYSRLREIIATQNGVELISTSANPELIKAEMDIASEHSPELEAKIENLVDAVCALTGAEEDEVYGWAILKLNNRLRTFKRIIDYIICGIGETNGCSWKGGNPYPHPWFDKVSRTSKALSPLSSFANGAGTKAVAEAGGVTPPEFADMNTDNTQ